jgi:vacuolar-type H+-ATPase catalytic subunit A/Vma1
MAEKVEYEKQWCKYELNEGELSAAAKTLALKTQELEQIEAEKKAVTARYSERIQTIQGEIRKAASLYKDGYEMRDIECTVERDYETGEIRYRRTDNFQIAARDKMTMGERQKRIEDLIPSERPVDPPEKTDEEIRQENETKRLMTSEKSSLN